MAPESMKVAEQFGETVPVGFGSQETQRLSKKAVTVVGRKNQVSASGVGKKVVKHHFLQGGCVGDRSHPSSEEPVRTTSTFSTPISSPEWGIADLLTGDGLEVVSVDEVVSRFHRNHRTFRVEGNGHWIATRGNNFDLLFEHTTHHRNAAVR
jgi:hypothetical protein